MEVAIFAAVHIIDDESMLILGDTEDFKERYIVTVCSTVKEPLKYFGLGDCKDV